MDHSHTTSTTCKPTVLYYSFVCQEYSQHLGQMFITDQENTSDVSMPSQLAPNVWILTTAPSAVTTRDYPHMPRRNNTVHWSEETHPYIMPTHSLQCYNTEFSSTPTICRTTLRSKYIFGYGEPKHDKYIIYEFSHMATLGATLEQESATTLGQHTLSSSRTTLQPHGHRHSTHHTLFTWRVNRRYRFNLDTVFTYRSLCNGYRITYTCRFGNILLLFLLALTCQISVPTFTTRYHAIYNCGWWCRGSTHLQMWWQGLTAYKTSQESWPAYRVYTYTDRELM